MTITTNRFLSEKGTNKVVAMITENIENNSLIKSIDNICLEETAFALVDVTLRDGERYQFCFSYNINRIEFLTVRAI